MKIKLTFEQEDHVVLKSLKETYKYDLKYDVAYARKLKKALRVIIKHYSTQEEWDSFFKERL